MPHFHIYLPRGMLKVKTRGWLRYYEAHGKVRVRRFAGWYFIWMTYEQRRKRDRAYLRWSQELGCHQDGPTDQCS